MAAPPASPAALAVPAALGAHELADRENAARVAANRRRAYLLYGSAAAPPALVLGLLVGLTAGAVVGAVVAAAVFVAVWVVVLRSSLPFAVHLVGAQPVSSSDLPSVANQVDGLCATIGVPRPEVWLVDDPTPNACAFDAAGSRAVVVVTSGLIERMDLIELEGVLAHELVHLKRRDAVVSAVAVATAGLVAYATGRDGLVHAAVGRGREYDADQGAALAVRYPPGLHDALATMVGAGAPAPALSSRPRHASGVATRRAPVFSGRRWAATRWVWIDPMVGEASGPVIGELDATPVRRDALEEW